MILLCMLQNIQGEVYEIDDKMLTNLDILEEYPKLYTRREEEIKVIQEQPNGLPSLPPVIFAWTYFLSDFRPELLQKPFLDSYSSEGPHNLPYVARYVRDKAFDHRSQVKIMVSS
jgi:gamma-glutamylaminecyclotransferase